MFFTFNWRRNDEIKKFLSIVNFQSHESRGLRAATVIYHQSRDILLLFGGTLGAILQFSCKTKKWTKWGDKIKVRGDHVMSVLTRDGKCVIIAGGCKSSKIDVLDIDKQCMMKCAIECPQKGPNLMVRTGDKYRDMHLIHGYSRNVKLLEIPVEISNLVLEYFCVEMLHWIGYSTSTCKQPHYQIEISKVPRNI